MSIVINKHSFVSGGGISIAGNKAVGLVYKENVIYKSKVIPKIVTFADGTDEEIGAMLEAHYKGYINIEDYWKVGDTRKMHLSAMSGGSGGEVHVEQDMTMIIIGIEHDDLKEPIKKRTKAAITLQCREILGNNGIAETGQNYGGTGQWSENPRRTWLNTMFISSLPNTIQPLVKTIIKKNLANHTDSTAGNNTEDKAFLPSYPEMFGSVSYDYYKGSVELEGEQYPYYNSDDRRIKYANNNGVASINTYPYWLRSLSSYNSGVFIRINIAGTPGYHRGTNRNSTGIAPAFCL